MPLLIHIPSPTLDQKTRPAAHLTRLAAIIQGHGAATSTPPGVTPILIKTAQSRQELRRALQNGADILYLFAHSTQRGLVFPDETTANGPDFASLLPARLSRRPQLIFFNTCYAASNGLAQSALDAGVKKVIAPNESIPLQHITGYAETFFERYVETRSKQQALHTANRQYEENGIKFHLLK
ncbi:MAG: CHAT domain-containing protein [Gammaproteobacteria bacterium]|nr:CHAT domain-containing protein [Gammaproteobacteria bacterium]MDH5652989.1 CHAT domain-containing protein [Gammaproteobacteria bacterium]